MNLNHLFLFKTVVEIGNITEAAKLLHMSQPAITMQMKRLEDKLDIPLITSYPKGIKPTDAGLVLLYYCEKFKEIEEQMWRSMEEYRDGNKGHIIIGAPLELRTYLLQKMKASFVKNYPGIEIEERTVNDDDIEGYVKRGIIDLGLTLNKDIDHFKSRITLLTHDGLILFSAVPDHNTLYISNKLLFNDEPELMQKYEKVITVENAELVKQAVSAGLGDGVSLNCTILSEITHQLVTVKEVLRTNPISIITRPAEKIQNSVKIFTNHVKTLTCFSTAKMKNEEN
jgi:DNA-binding transcriptional LysR family regulator